MVNKKNGKQNRKSVKFTQGFSLRTIKVWQFEIIDSVKCVYCLNHAYKGNKLGLFFDACVNVFLVHTLVLNNKTGVNFCVYIICLLRPFPMFSRVWKTPLNYNNYTNGLVIH